MAQLSIKRTDERDDRLRRLMQATGENTQAGAIDVAMKHYLTDLEAKRAVVDELPEEVIDALSSPWLPIEKTVTVETSVGRDDGH